MRSATRTKLDVLEPSGTAPARSKAGPKSEPKPGPKPGPSLGAVPAATAAPMRPAARPKPKTFHASVQVTRVEEWFVEAETAEEARQLLENGHGQRSQIGECLHFEISNLID